MLGVTSGSFNYCDKRLALSLLTFEFQLQISKIIKPESNGCHYCPMAGVFHWCGMSRQDFSVGTMGKLQSGVSHEHGLSCHFSESGSLTPEGRACSVLER